MHGATGRVFLEAEPLGRRPVISTFVGLKLAAARSMKCQHENILVTYQHPHGDIVNVAVSKLRDSRTDSTRPIMTLTNARCANCGALISRREIRTRCKPGGDLHDARFRFV